MPGLWFFLFFLWQIRKPWWNVLCVFAFVRFCPSEQIHARDKCPDIAHCKTEYSRFPHPTAEILGNRLAKFFLDSSVRHFDDPHTNQSRPGDGEQQLAGAGEELSRSH
ncbi:MAG: hypothetical protein ACLPRE_02975 [Limisphaerales bacterium]